MMSIREKILLYFSVVTIVLVGVAMVFIYTLFYGYREEEFHEQQKNKIATTLRLLTEIRGIDEQLIRSMDKITINELYDEKLLIFDQERKLIYSSIDDTTIPAARDLLQQLSPQTPWLAQKDGRYDVVGLYYQLGGVGYYGISKAYDESGYHNLNYLRYELFFTFLCIFIVIIAMSHYLAKKITQPIVELTGHINSYSFKAKPEALAEPASKNEVMILTQRFNEFVNRMNAALSFQKHAVHHISHELETPIAILVSNFEKIEKEQDRGQLMEMVRNQKDETMNLSEIINSLLEFAKTEAGHVPLHTRIRVDELIFDVADELSLLHPDFQFCIEYPPGIDNEERLIVLANDRLLKACLLNLMVNCIQYSSNGKASINISTGPQQLKLDFKNQGPIILQNEQDYIFEHFFRGENSKGKRGFGLGLVFVHKILALHGGSIAYSSEGTHHNTFTVLLPLS